MKNFQVLSQSDLLKWCPHTHFKNWKKEKNGKTDLICAQLTLQLTFFIGPGPGPVQNFIKILMFDTYLRNISFRFQSNLRKAHYNWFKETIIPGIEMFEVIQEKIRFHGWLCKFWYHRLKKDYFSFWQTSQDHQLLMITKEVWTQILQKNKIFFFSFLSLYRGIAKGKKLSHRCRCFTSHWKVHSTKTPHNLNFETLWKTWY